MPALRPAAMVVATQPQHRGVQRIVEIAHLVVDAVDGDGVLDEVVGPDGEEVEPAGEDVGADRGGRHLDHRADRHRRIVALVAGVELPPCSRARSAAPGRARWCSRASGSSSAPDRSPIPAGWPGSGSGTDPAPSGTAAPRAGQAPGSTWPAHRGARRRPACPRRESRVRMVTGAPFNAATSSEYASNCSCSSGGSRRFMNRNSVR